MRQSWNSHFNTIVESDTVAEATNRESSVYIQYINKNICKEDNQYTIKQSANVGATSYTKQVIKLNTRVNVDNYSILQIVIFIIL